MYNIQYIKKIDEILDLFIRQQYNDSIERNRSSYMYRGLPNSTYNLQTSLYRNCNDKQFSIESSILRNFSKYAINEDPLLSSSIWRQMVIGQHHGLPTRLMDWTYSPLIGLHFATAEQDLNQMDQHDCVLWEIDLNEMNCLLPREFKQVLKKENAYLFTIDMLEKIVSEISDYDEKMGDTAMLLMEPPSIDQRIISQYSYFSIVPRGISDIEKFLAEKTSNTTKYIVDKTLRWRIRDMLDQMNINERILFPGLDGVSAWMKRHYYVK